MRRHLYATPSRAASLAGDQLYSRERGKRAWGRDPHYGGRALYQFRELAAQCKTGPLCALRGGTRQPPSEPVRIASLVDEADTAWTVGNFAVNQASVNVE